jgi:hypothetical protein
MNPFDTKCADDAKVAEGSALADINVTVHSDRRTLEAIYLELRELAKQNGLKLDYRLTQAEPRDQVDS